MERKTNNFFNMIVSILMAALFLAGCAKERADQITQGQGENLMSINAFQNKVFEVETKESIFTGLEETTHANNIKLTAPKEDDEVKFINLMDIVEVDAKEKMIKEMLRGIPFRGRPNHKYKVQLYLNDHYIKLYKLGKKEDLPFHELTYASKVGELYVVPLLGYPITLHALDHKTDPNGNNTNVIGEFQKTTLAESEFFRINWGGRITYKGINKADIFPRNYFKGEWFYSATIVSASVDKATQIGQNLNIDLEAEEASRVKFVELSDRLRIVNTDIDENVDANDEINLQAAQDIPALYYQFSQPEGSGKIEFEEAENNDSGVWRDRNFVRLDFLNSRSMALFQPVFSSSGALMNSPRLTAEEGEFHSLEITKNYLSFTIFYPKRDMRIQYSLLRATKEPKKGIVYKKEYRDRFGFFAIEKNFIMNSSTHRDEDLEKKVMMNRFYPEDGVITYHLSEQTTDEFVGVAQAAIDAWDKTFQQAGTGIRVKLVTSPRVPLGDIRYNIINLVDTKDGSGLLGFGPSLVDSESGEIISATANIYANPFRESIVNGLRNYVRNRLGMFQESFLPIASDKVKGKSAVGVSSNGLASDVATQVSNLFERVKESSTSPFLNRFSDSREIVGRELSKLETLIQDYRANAKVTKEANLSRYRKFGETCSFANSYRDRVVQIEERCTDKLENYQGRITRLRGRDLNLENYISKLKEQGLQYAEDEMDYLQACADVLINDDVMATLVHELGHNFGLRHNFAGTSDEANFLRNEEGREYKSSTSSIMDYPMSDVREMQQPGPYDLAAIRFGYARKVEVLNEAGQVQMQGLPENPDAQTLRLFSESDDKNMQELKVSLKPYRYCTDAGVQRKDPLCNRFDYGANVVEVVENYISRFHALHATLGHKYDRIRSYDGMVMGNIALGQTFINLLVIYQQWRHHLASYLKSKNHNIDPYLTSYTAGQLDQEILEMTTQGPKKEIYKQYYQASRKIYEFFKGLIQTPGRYCLAKAKDTGADRILDFENLRMKVLESRNSNALDCDHPETIAYLEDRGLEYHGKIGSFIKDQLNDLNIDPSMGILPIQSRTAPLHQRLKVTAAGIYGYKIFASVMMTVRLPLLFQLGRDNFMPNMMDEPQFRNEMGQYLTFRIIKGLRASEAGLGKEPESPREMAGEKSFTLFALEKELIETSMLSYVNALGVPGNARETGERINQYAPTVMRPGNFDAEKIPPQMKYTQINGLMYIGTNPFANALISLEKEIQTLKDMADNRIEPLSLDELDKLFSRTGLAIPTKEELAAKKFGDHVKSVQDSVQLMIMIMQFGGGDSMGAILETLFTAEFELFLWVRRNEEKFNELKEFTTEAALAEIGSESITLDSLSKAKDERIQETHEMLLEQEAMIQQYLNHKTDYDAQADLITGILKQLGGQ